MSEILASEAASNQLTESSTHQVIAESNVTAKYTKFTAKIAAEVLYLLWHNRDVGVPMVKLSLKTLSEWRGKAVKRHSTYLRKVGKRLQRRGLVLWLPQVCTGNEDEQVQCIFIVERSYSSTLSLENRNGLTLVQQELDYYRKKDGKTLRYNRAILDILAKGF
jgi:hypothetical protein